MSNQVYSSKSLLDAIGTNKQENHIDTTNSAGETAGTSNSGDNNNNNNNKNNGTFFLANSLPNVPKPEEEQTTKQTETELSKKYKDNDTLEKGGAKNERTNNSDAESISSDIVMNTTNERDATSKSKTIQLLPLLNPSNFLSNHDLLLSAFYEEHKLEIINTKKLTFRIITWNLNQMKPPSLNSLAGKSGREWAAFFYAGDSTINDENKEGLADIYSINFQETISLKSFSKSNTVIDEWVNFLLAVLNAISSTSYSLVYKTGLLGLTSIILAKTILVPDKSKDIDGQIHNVRENTLGLGYLRWANKGCISLRLRIGGIDLGIGNYSDNDINKDYKHPDHNSFKFNELDETVGKIPGLEVQLLNVHLVHGEDDAQIQQRWDSWAKIENKIGLDDRTVKLALDPTKIEIKDEAQKRLELKLKQKLHAQNKLDPSNLDKEMEALSLNNDSVRSSYVPINFSKVEMNKFDGVISSVDLDRFKFVTEAQKALVVCGDTNYRLSLPLNDSTNLPQVIQELIKNGRWNDLLQHDQLKNEMKSKHVLVGFEEPEINFSPTFKVKADAKGNWIMTPPSSASSEDTNQGNANVSNVSNKRIRKPPPTLETPTDSATSSNLMPPYYVPIYDTKRLPAYTDRIAYVRRPFFNVIDGTYTSTGNTGSDHLPVTSTYELEAPLVDEKKLHFFKGKFNEAWDAVINRMTFFDLDKTVTVRHSMRGKKEVAFDTIPVTVDERITTDGGNIAISTIAGECVNISIPFENIVDEAFNFKVVEQTSGGWFGTKIDINCKSLGDSNDINKSTPTCTIEAHTKGEITFTFIPSAAGLLERVFIAEIPEYSLCPAYRKFLALTVNVNDIFSTSFEAFTANQFDNINKCFQFVQGEKSIVGLLDYISELGGTADLTTLEWDLVREVTLWEFLPAKYQQLNVDGIEAVKRNEKQKFNLGSKAVLAFLYIWLKTQNSNFNTDSSRGKIIFSNVIKLIKYLKLDAERGYNLFGWLFSDEYELEDYLERDFDVKVDL